MPVNMQNLQNLAAAPRSVMMDGKELLIPQFTLVNGDVHFETPQA